MHKVELNMQLHPMLLHPITAFPQHVYIAPPYAYLTPLYNYMQAPLQAVDLLLNLTASEEQPEPAVTLFLLGDILNRFNSTGSPLSEQLAEVLQVMCNHFMFIINLNRVF